MTRRLILSYLAVTVFTLLILEIPLARFVAEFELARLETGFERNANVLASIYEDALRSNSQFNSEPASQYAADADVRVIVVDSEGRSIIDTEEAPNQDFSDRPEIIAALAGNRVADTRDSVTLGRPLSYVAVPVASGGVVHGAVRITFNPADVSQRIAGYWWRLGAIAAVVLITVAIVGWIIARSVTRPLRDLQAAAIRAGDGELDSLIDPTDAPSEVADLVVSFNTMATRLDGLLVRQRRFVADASHELRTPLTALRLRLENVAHGATIDQVADLDAAMDEIDRLTTLVGQLLTIARTEVAASGLETSELVSIITERVDLWSALAAEQSITLEMSSVTGPVTVETVPGSIEQIFDNLVSNALSATPPGGSVMVTVQSMPGQAVVEISDTGRGMTDEQRQMAFDRFWRADHTAPGTGLGLAIVRDLVESAGGTASISANKSGGTTVSVTFPETAVQTADLELSRRYGW